MKNYNKRHQKCPRKKVATGKKKSTSIQKRATSLSEQLFAPNPLLLTSLDFLTHDLKFLNFLQEQQQFSTGAAGPVHLTGPL